MANSLLAENFNQYLDDHIKIIFKIAYAYCRDPENRQDLIQDIILQLWKSFPSYDEKHKFSTWTYRIALNVSISHLRKEKTRTKAHEAMHEQTLVEYSQTDEDEHLEQLYKCIEQLKPIDRAIIIQYLDGLKAREMAEIMGLTPSNISTRIQRIKHQLKLCFNPK